MINLSIDINGRKIGAIEIQNLKQGSRSNVPSTYEVTADIDGETVSSVFRHVPDDGIVVCMAQALQGLITSMGINPTELSHDVKVYDDRL